MKKGADGSKSLFATAGFFGMGRALLAGAEATMEKPAVVDEQVTPAEFVTGDLASNRFGVVGIEDRPKMPVAQNNAMSAASLTADVEKLALSFGKLLPADVMREPENVGNKYICGSDASCGDCNYGGGGATGANDCSAACDYWKKQWQPIMDLISTSVDKHDSDLKSAFSAPNIVEQLATIRVKFDGLQASSNAASQPRVPDMQRAAFLDGVNDVLCNEIGTPFHTLRTQIREQMCKIDKIAADVQQLCTSAFGSFSHEAWPAKNAKYIASHVAQCKPAQVNSHLQTLASTSAALCVAEASVCKLAQWCTENLAGLIEQKNAVLRGMPRLGKRNPYQPSNWTREVGDLQTADLDIWQKHLFGNSNCTSEKFIECVSAYLDAEPDCSLIYDNAAILFQDCYKNLAFYMDERIRRAKLMEQAFVSLVDALVQQRFVVEIGAFLMRCVAKVQLPQLASGKTQTPVDIFSTLFGAHALRKIDQADIMKMQVELDSAGKEWTGYTRKIVATIYSPIHMNSIQRVAQQVFTAELVQLGDLLTQCSQFQESGYTEEQWRAACKSHVDANMRHLSKLAAATTKYLAGNHEFATGRPAPTQIPTKRLQITSKQ